MSRAAPALLALALMACGTPRKETLPDGGSLEGPVTFRLSFNTTHSNAMYLQTRDGPEWISVLDAHDAELTTLLRCDCLCEECACPGCVPGAPRVVQVPQFSSTTWTWSGFEFPKSGQCSGHDCRARRSAPSGKYTARFCHSYSIATAANGDQTIGPKVCTSVPFDYPADGGVVSLDFCDC